MLNVDKDQAMDIVFGDDPDFDVISKRIVDQGRWETTKEVIVKQKSTGKFFRTFYSHGSTEMQDYNSWEDEDPEFTEVFPVSRMIVDYLSQSELDANED